MDQLLTSDKAALFLMKGIGSQPMFRGFHAFTGDMTKADGSILSLYQMDIGDSVKVAETRGSPESVSIVLDAPLQAIGDMVGARMDCPMHLILVADTCLSPNVKRSWGRWGVTEPQVIVLIPNVKVEQRTLSNLASREVGGSVSTGSVQIKFDDWTLIKGGNEIALTSIVTGTTLVGLASASNSGCKDPECGGAEMCSVWYAVAANGEVWKRSGEDGYWVKQAVSPSWTVNDGGVYADGRLVLVGGSDGVASSYGVLRSIDGGTTWAKVVFTTAPAGVTGLVRKIVRSGEMFFAFTSSGIWRSTNDGRSWTLVRPGSHLSGAFDGFGFGVAVNTSKVFVTRSSGKKWTEISAWGVQQKDVAVAGGYVHIVDSVLGYARLGIDAVKARTAIEWEVNETITDVTDIAFVNSLLGYRLRGTNVDRTLNGGYSWETLTPVTDTPTWTQMALCGGRLGVIGDTFFGYYSPFFDDEYFAGAAL